MVGWVAFCPESGSGGPQRDARQYGAPVRLFAHSCVQIYIFMRQTCVRACGGLSGSMMRMMMRMAAECSTTRKRKHDAARALLECVFGVCLWMV